MNKSLYGLFIEDIASKGYNSIGYFETEESLNNKLNELQAIKVPSGHSLFKVEHEYNKIKNIITEFNYDKRVYI